MKKFLQQLLCRHRQPQFIRNIHGDEINEWGGNRSLWRCTRCGHVFSRPMLVDEAEQKPNPVTPS